MAQIDRIVSVNISRQTQQIDITSFEVPLILVRVDEAVINMPNRVETFNDLESVGSLFGVTHPAYLIAQKLLSGALKPAEFKIGKARTSSAPGQGTAVGVVTGTTVTNPTSYTVTDQPSNGTVVVSATGNYSYTGNPGYTGSDSFDVELDDGTDTETVTITVNVIAAPLTPETYVEALQAVMEADNEWYVLLSDARFDQDILSLASTVEATRKIYGTSSSDINILSTTSTTDVAYLLSVGGYTRTFVLYSATSATEYPEARWVGEQIIEVPGSNTWAYKSLSGVTVSKLSGTDVTALENKNANYYIEVKRAPITQTGRMASGEFIDIMIFVDWLHARIQESVFYRLVNRKKIPMTRAGAALIESEIRAVLSTGVANGGIADDTPYTVISPDPLMLPEQERAARRLGDFRFEARLAGAVHYVTIRGIVTV